MTLSPFVFEEDDTIKNSAGVDCFDESSPCLLEQFSECVIDISKSQSKYVPWLMCMDSKGETSADVSKCAAANGINFEEVSSCQKNNGTALLQKLVKHDSSVDSTPTVKINGKAVGGQQGPTYSNVRKVICTADPTLKGCSSDFDDDATVIV